MKPTTRHGTGQTGEYLVAAELARLGFTVALPTGNAEVIDILAHGPGKSFAVQVKTAARGDHQFNLGKFIDISFEDDDRQTVHGRLPGLDSDVLIAFVFLGETAGEDEFAWTTVGEFADFLGAAHKAYLDRNNGRRPGKNPRSLHAAHNKTSLQSKFPAKSALEVLGAKPE